MKTTGSTYKKDTSTMERKLQRVQTYKKTPNTHTKYMIEGKTTKSTYTKRRQNTMEREL